MGIHGGPWGRLVAVAEDDARARVVLERAAQALELARMVERDDIAIQLRVHGGFLLDLLDGRLGSEAVAATRLRAFGVPARGVRRARRPAALARPRPTSPAQRRMVRLSEQLLEAVHASGCFGVVGVLDGEHVGLLLAGDGRGARHGRPRADARGAGRGAAPPARSVDRVLAAAPSLRAARVVADVAATLPAR